VNTQTNSRASNRDVGQRGENLATEYLEALGYSILDRNWRGSRCELDIVARDGLCLVFCEVKTRTSASRGYPIEAVTPRKLDNIRSAALTWLANHRVRHSGMRIDVVGIVLSSTGDIEITHVKGVEQ
jgi:putative endonuclease